MVRKEIDHGLYILHEQSGKIYETIEDCSIHTSVKPTTIRAILEDKKRNYKGTSFCCVDENGKETDIRYRSVSKYDRIHDDSPEDPAFVEERNRIYFSPFICCETGEQFESVIEAHEKTGISSRILVDCLRSGIAYEGYTFKYL